MTVTQGAASYRLAQTALADLKAAVHEVLERAGSEGCSNVEIGRALGIYQGHVGHEGHIPRTLLSIMQNEGVVEQDAAKRWRLKQPSGPHEDEAAG